MSAWTPIPVPAEVTSSALEIVTKARKVITVLDRFTTDASLDAADKTLAELVEKARALRIQVRGVRAAEQRRLRQAEAEAERAEAENARITAGRIAAISSKGAAL